MAAVRPMPLADTSAKAGYDQIDPMHQWFLGGGTAAGATATGIADDDRYGLDLQNSGVGGLSFRAFSGNGNHFARVNNSGVAFGGTFSHTGSASFSGAMSVASLTVASGVTVTTGATVLGGSATVANGFAVTTGASVLGGTLTVTGATTMASSLNVLGAATAGTLRVTGGTTIVGDVLLLTGATITGPLDVTGTAHFRSSLQVDGVFNVTGVATFQTTVSVVTALNVTGAATFLTTVSVTGAATFSSTVTGSQFASNVADGAPPLTSTSTTVCTHINADMVDGLNATDFVTNNSYGGDGTSNRTITLGYQPKAVYIACNGAGTDVAIFLNSAASNANIGMVRVGGGTTNLAVLGETKLVSTGFQVDSGGTNGISNTSGDTYSYTVWR